MSFEPQRFIHAANLNLDLPVQVAQSLSDEQRSIVEDATLIAFDNLVLAAIDEKVDFVLIAGQSFVERHRSLRARVALLRGFEALDESGIPAYVVPGRSDPASAWRAIPRLPGNITLCDGQEPVAVMRGRTVIATITNGLFPGETDQFGIRSAPGDTGRPLQIGVMPWQPDAEHPGDSRPGDADASVARRLQETPIEYAAIVGDSSLTTQVGDAVAHNPGPTQPLCDTGCPGVCTLVRADAEGGIRCAPLSTAPVRWHAFSSSIDAVSDSEELLQQTRRRLAVIESDSSEQLRLVCLTVTGVGDLFESLHERAWQQQFAQQLRKSLIDSGLRIPSMAVSCRLLPTGGPRHGESALAAGFRELLEEQLPFTAEELEEVLSESPMAGSELWRERIGPLIERVDCDVITARVRRLGRDWFADDADSAQDDSERSTVRKAG